MFYEINTNPTKEELAEKVAKISVLRPEIDELRRQLREKEDQINELISSTVVANHVPDSLTCYDITRFSRQILVEDVGVNGQLKLKNASVAIVGLGGLGCPCALYLAGAGIGRLGLIDFDKVEMSNLQRQTLHSEETIGKPKVESAKANLLRLNSKIRIDAHNVALDRNNAAEILSLYDVVVDATDNVVTRYLLNDACVLLKKPLVSGSALQLEGQLTVYNYRSGPCYRCVFPVPPPAETVTTCGEGGILGPVVGIIGALQAMEAIKVLIESNGVLTGKLLLFDGAVGAFRTVQLRKKNEHCEICSGQSANASSNDFSAYCAMGPNAKDYDDDQLQLLGPKDRVSVFDLHALQTDDKPFILIDVRSENEFAMCSIAKSVNVPIKKIKRNEVDESLRSRLATEESPILFICRRGNDSQLAVEHFRKLCAKSVPKDIVGGLHAWARSIDPLFPKY